MHIIHIASELAPIAKVGGLGDVLYGLSQALTRLGHTVEIILPKYDCLDFKLIQNLQIEAKLITTIEESSPQTHTIWSGECDRLKLLLIESHHPLQYFHRGMIYGCPDDVHRFAHFSQAALSYITQANKQVDVLHLHDWPTALVSLFTRQQHCPYKTLLTIHNLEHQGRYSSSLLTHYGIHSSDGNLEEMMQDPLLPDTVNILKGGLLAADAITTVSPTYRKEILTVEGSCGLHDTLIRCQSKLTGILNGIDEQFWNPDTDPYLVAQFNTHHVNTESELEAVLTGKRENRNHLSTHVHLRESSSPLVASITRLVPQKSPHLIRAALLRTLKQGGQFVLLGTTQIPEIQAEFAQIQIDFKDNRDVAILLDYDEALSHLIFASADLFIIPSLFEPCGLTQLISLRYGAIPIARATGGLADTVFDLDTAERPVSERNGFTFDFPDEEGVYWALDRALRCFQEIPHIRRQLMKQGMGMDFSWKHTAPEYVKLYDRLRIKA